MEPPSSLPPQGLCTRPSPARGSLSQLSFLQEEPQPPPGHPFSGRTSLSAGGALGGADHTFCLWRCSICFLIASLESRGVPEAGSLVFLFHPWICISYYFTWHTLRVPQTHIEGRNQVSFGCSCGLTCFCMSLVELHKLQACYIHQQKFSSRKKTLKVYTLETKFNEEVKTNPAQLFPNHEH